MLPLIASAMLLVAACGGKEPVPGPEPAPTIEFSPSALTLSPEGGEGSVRVQASAVWDVRTDGQDWYELVSSPQVFRGESILKVKAQPNVSGETRRASVSFSNGEASASLELTQACVSYVPDGYTLVWQDEFSGGSEDLVKKWRFEDWAPGRVNHELQRYVPDDRRTAFVENGTLNIVAAKDGSQVVSARMNSRGSWLYGYVEASIRLPKGKGTWPAFWMMPDDFSKGWPACGEIDIMEEVGTHANYTSSSIHCNSYNHVKGTQKTAERFTAGAEDGFHVYALEWTEDYIRTYVDGQVLLDFPNDKKGDDNTWPFNKECYVILNLAWGGDWGGMNGVDENALPCTMQVDYVRVYKKQ